MTATVYAGPQFRGAVRAKPRPGKECGTTLRPIPAAFDDAGPHLDLIHDECLGVRRRTAFDKEAALFEKACISSDSMAVAISAYSLIERTSCGVPAGARRPGQGPRLSKPSSPLSAMVGTSGSMKWRSRDVTAIGRRSPLLEMLGQDEDVAEHGDQVPAEQILQGAALP